MTRRRHPGEHKNRHNMPKATQKVVVRTEGVCPTGKKKYESKKLAKTALAASRRSDAWDGVDGDAYRCATCQGWHVTHHHRHPPSWTLTPDPVEPEWTDDQIRQIGDRVRRGDSWATIDRELGLKPGTAAKWWRDAIRRISQS